LPSFLPIDRHREANVLKRLFGREDEEKIEEGLAKTRHGFLERVASVFGPVDITDHTWEALEEQLILSDVGAATAAELIEALRREARDSGVRRADELPAVLRRVMVRALTTGPGEPQREDGDDADADDLAFVRPWVVLVVGVNGSGKTTTIAKLAAWHKAQGRSALLVAADTFRAAAQEQLEIWAERAAVPLVSGASGGDPGAVVFDALSSRAGKAADVVIVDTAGRLHTQKNLMDELRKIARVAERVVDGAPQETVLVLDATTGQNGLLQARAFTEAVPVTGLALAKLDSSAKGGVALAVVQELGVPVRYVGTGEGLGDLALFDADAYVAGLLGQPTEAIS
jgi:fused signal recognition particle receptor